MLSYFYGGGESKPTESSDNLLEITHSPRRNRDADSASLQEQQVQPDSVDKSCQTDPPVGDGDNHHPCCMSNWYTRINKKTFIGFTVLAIAVGVVLSPFIYRRLT